MKKMNRENVDMIVEIVLSDEKLFGYVLSLVNSRLPMTKLRSDPDWCRKVVDLSIEQALRDINVMEILENMTGTNESKAVSSSGEQDIIQPTFSSSEPKTVVATAPRRVVKELNKKKAASSFAPQSQSLARSISASPPVTEFDRSRQRFGSVESDVSTVLMVTDASYDAMELSAPSAPGSDPYGEVQSASSVASSTFEEEGVFAPKEGARSDRYGGGSPELVMAQTSHSQALRSTIEAGAGQGSRAGRRDFEEIEDIEASIENDEFISGWEKHVLNQIKKDGTDNSDDGKGQGKTHANEGSVDYASLVDHSGYLHSSGVDGQAVFFDQAQFDSDADYRNDTGEDVPRKSKADGRVKFATTLVTDVTYRDRVLEDEKGELFYNNDEEYQFTLDQTRETERAELVGMTWMEWMDARTDEDIDGEGEADSLADFKLYTGEYYEDDEDYTHPTHPTHTAHTAHPTHAEFSDEGSIESDIEDYLPDVDDDF
mmetsp:Transcript_32115/g.69259  ORF Transcript_32115/g.69259 Transcript_32115/m.69259 type:complete len:486 (+) Transcript_32115:76-1533(+)